MTPKKILNTLNNKEFCRISGTLKLTKTPIGFTEALIYRDRELEERAFNWMQSRSSRKTLFGRYKHYDPTYEITDVQHFAGRLVSGSGAICSGQNIFLIFPHCTNNSPTRIEDVFGIEFIDVWSNIMQTIIFPIIDQKFEPSPIFLTLKYYMEEVIFISSIFHEIGHRVGPYRIAPMGSLVTLSQHNFDIMAELATDLLLISNLKEFPEVALFIILQRIFWYGRVGFSKNELVGNINTDNDAWIGAFLWEHLRKTGIIESNKGIYRFCIDRIAKTSTELIHEIDSLVKNIHNSKHEAQVNEWRKSAVPNISGKFVYSNELRCLLKSLHHIPEIPAPKTSVVYSQTEMINSCHI